MMTDEYLQHEMVKRDVVKLSLFNRCVFLYCFLCAAYEDRAGLLERDHRRAALCSGPGGTALHRYNRYMHGRRHEYMHS